MSQSRQLAAIMFTDIVGYTSLMGKDSNKALELVRISKEIQKPLVEKHQGIWLKEMGDGAMAQFKSALDAVNCAIKIQEAFKNGFNGQLRIGIHLGDITIDNDEVYGDGVNVASRIESVAESGSVYISEAVQGAIKGSNIHTSFRGEKRLKNVDHPVRVYKIVDQAEATTKGSLKKYLPWAAIVILLSIIGLWKLSGSKTSGEGKTIAVLPLKMQNADNTKEYLIPGITQELISSLGKVNALIVVNPRSTMRFMASVAPVQQAQSELTQSDYFLSGSFRENNNRLSLDMVLHDRLEKQLWSNSYADDISNLQQLTGKIAVDVAQFIRVELTEAETSRIIDIPPVDPEMLELLLKGITHLKTMTQEDIPIGLNYLQQAKDKDPGNSKAWSMLAEGLVTIGHSPAAPPGVWQEAKAAAVRAIQLDSLNAEAWAALAHTKTYFEWDYPGAVFGYNKANSLNPNLAANHYHYSWHLRLLDSLDRAVEEHELAFRLDPLDPFQAARLAHIYLIAGNLDGAKAEIERAYRLHDNFPVAMNIEGMIFIEIEQYDSAEMVYNKMGPRGVVGLGMTYFKSGRYDKGMEKIRTLEENLNSFTSVALSMLYAEIDSLDKFFEYANYEPAHAFHPWLRVSVKNPRVIADPRFKQLMDKMNLPMPVLKEEQEQEPASSG